jgi:hypothetical protein
VVWHGPSRCLGAEEAWASSSWSVLTLCVSNDVSISAWTGLPWVRPSGAFLVVKDVGSRG